MVRDRVILALVLLGSLALYLPFQQLSRSTTAYNEALAQTPPMGWNSWNTFRCKVDEWQIRAIADTLVASGMRDAGYQYVVVDDCWQTGRDQAGLIHASTRTFPGGMAALAAYVHERGLKFGIYTSAGSQTCGGRPGSLGFEYQDAALYAAWGVDFVKVDWCFSDGLDARQQYALWRDAIAATGRPMLLSICEWGSTAPWEWAPNIGNMWRTTQDIRPDWPTILRNLDETAWRTQPVGPGRWHDPDMLEVGNGDLSLDENRAHFSMWALLAAPLIAGNDLRSMSPEVQAILTNREVIAVNQDAAGIPGNIVDDTGTGLQTWMKPLGDGSRAIALLNRTESAAPIHAFWAKVGAHGPQRIRDLWSATELGSFDGVFSAMVPAHGVILVRAWPTQPAIALADLQPVSFRNGFGPFERNQSNGEDAAGDGHPLTLNGRVYSHGLGVHAPSELVYELDGRCSRFSAAAGVDDEAGTHGAVRFQVWGDEILRFDSGPVNGDAAPALIDLDVSGIQRLSLVVSDGGDWTDYDHADWAEAVVACG